VKDESADGEHGAARRFLRHAVATLAYRAGKVLRGFPENLVEVRSSPSSRTPLEILSHLGDLMDWAESMVRAEQRWQPARTTSWTAACERFFAGLEALDAALAAAAPSRRAPEEIFQGPVADALTHVGQLALVRGAVGAPVRPESYARADIRAGSVGREQPAPRAEFDGDASWPEPKPSEAGRG
jgi:hypothetical protein